MMPARDTPKAMRWLEKVLLCIVLGLVALRATIIETPLIDQLQTRMFLSSEIVSLLLSTAVLACMGLWLLVSLLRGQFRWRKTGFGIAVVVFILAGVLSAFFASNKRAAITDMVTLATPMLMGLYLVQLLTSAIRIRLALLLILAVGVAATVQCVDQKTSNDTVIAEYEANPAEFLQKQGIEPDGMEHWMYEHRLYSKDIRGFLMTSNSAASFFLMAVFAGLGLCLQATRKKMSQESIAALVCYILAFGVVLSGLFLTQSKGGIGTFILGVALLILLLVFGRTIWKRRRALGIVILLLVLVAAGFVIHYGMQHGRLPGGNSMLVRWQYWVSAGEMARDHIATGVGGGNFPEFYTHYKNPAASETVQNPHNWILSLLSQYGPLGLAAFVLAVFIPVYKAYQRLFQTHQTMELGGETSDKKVWIGVLAAASVMLLFVRPGLVDAEFLYQRVDIRAAAYVVLYLIPAGVFIGAFIFLRVASLGDTSVNGCNDRLALALMCGLIAVLIHNLIDFAIFEPGIFGVFWLFVAIIVAQVVNAAEPSQDVIVSNGPRRLGLLAGLTLVGIVHLTVVIIPPMRAENLFKRAILDDIRRIELVEAAITADSLSSKTAYQAAGIFRQAYQQQRVKDSCFLDKALEFAHVAAARNPADFKPRRLLGQTEIILAEQAEGEQKEKYLQMAFDDLGQAVNRYPGSGKLHYLLANVAEQLKRETIALCHYQIAVEIEDAYRGQFRIMYPERETVISRLGDTAYTDAKVRIEELSGEMIIE